MSLSSLPDAECPKCAAPRPAAALECARCGVIFAKFVARAAPPAALPPDGELADPQAAGRPSAAPLEPLASADPLERAGRIGKALLVGGLAIWTWQFARLPIGAGVMDSVLHLPDLVFHEAGHILFSPFGRFITVLGGSLFQVLVPVTLAAAFLKQHDAFGAAVCTWWAGENLLDLAPYIADARALQLVLLGGHTGAEVEGHDWEYLLTTLGWMRHDRALGVAAHDLGLAVMVAALGWGAYSIMRDRPAAGASAPPLMS